MAFRQAQVDESRRRFDLQQQQRTEDLAREDRLRIEAREQALIDEERQFGRRKELISLEAEERRKTDEQRRRQKAQQTLADLNKQVDAIRKGQIIGATNLRTDVVDMYDDTIITKAVRSHAKNPTLQGVPMDVTITRLTAARALDLFLEETDVGRAFNQRLNAGGKTTEDPILTGAQANALSPRDFNFDDDEEVDFEEMIIALLTNRGYAPEEMMAKLAPMSDAILTSLGLTRAGLTEVTERFIPQGGIFAVGRGVGK